MKGFGFGLVAILVIGLIAVFTVSVPVITLTRPGYQGTSFLFCQACHGTGKAAVKLEPEIITGILPKEIMLVKHGQLLYEWKDQVVRQGKRVTPESWTHYSNTPQSCTLCHGSVKIKIDCWQCHTQP